MKELLLLRHAKSSWATPGMADFDRPLSKRGRRAAASLARFFDAEGLRPALVLSSDARRTRETLDLIRDSLGGRVAIHLEPKLYLADPSTLLERLGAVPDNVPSVLIIGHNPGLQDFALELADAAGSAGTEAAARMENKFPTAALARFRLKVDRWRDLSVDTLQGAVKIVGYTIPADLETQE
jgi:phosphohistidine phosphatase